jgi:hypothetical protein
MSSFFKDRFEIFRSTLPRASILLIFGIFQAAEGILVFVPIFQKDPWFRHASQMIPWYGWTIGWLGALWLSSLGYSLGRKKHFDETSLNFFKAFLDFLIQQGSGLFDYSDEKNFYQKIRYWQHQAIQGIAIGLGPEESQKFFQKMELQSPVSDAYKKSQESRSNEPLCLSLQANLEELKAIRMNLRETKARAKGEMEALRAKDAALSPARPETLRLPE